jgi:hypothetical protein
MEEPQARALAWRVAQTHAVQTFLQFKREEINGVVSGCCRIVNKMAMPSSGIGHLVYQDHVRSVGMNPSRLVHRSGIQERLVDLHAWDASSGDEAREDVIGCVLSGTSLS